MHLIEQAWLPEQAELRKADVKVEVKVERLELGAAVRSFEFIGKLDGKYVLFRAKHKLVASV